MAYPTEMTVATGTTVYAGDPRSDERIVSREVRVSVTYQIEEEETNLADLAHEKMAEVERARLAAQDWIERDRRDPYGHEDAPFDPALEPPDEDDACPFPEEADYLIAHGGQAYNGYRDSNGGHGPKGNHHLAATVTQGGAAWTPPVEPDKVTTPETDWATKPQVLALGSHFRRLGLSPQDQTALLRERFGKFRPERLTKEEAAGLMRTLERGEWEPNQAAAIPVH